MEEKKKKKKIKIEKIIDMEWQMFQKVENIGGRASCQDDFETFYIMRFSQYGSWTDEMVNYYLDFAEDALLRGRNLVSEKYARMMEETILRDPAGWLWTHRRWKHKREEKV